MVFMDKQSRAIRFQAADRILNACTRQTLADSAVYKVYQVRRENVEGPSIRLAEVLAQNWGISILVSANYLKKTACQYELHAGGLETNVRTAKGLSGRT